MNKLKKKSDRKLRSIQAFVICVDYCNSQCKGSGDTTGYASATASNYGNANKL